MQFQKVNGAWKIVWEQLRLAPAPVPAQRFISGTIEVAPELEEVVHVRYCLLLEDDGGQTRFWERLQVRNIGDQTLRLSIIVELYKAKE